MIFDWNMKGQKAQKQSNIYHKHMWGYQFDISGNRATRNQRNPGFYPMALHQSIKQNTKSVFRVKVKSKNGEARLGVASKQIIDQNAWTREFFMYFDGNHLAEGKRSIISHQLKQIGPNMKPLSGGEVLLRMQVHPKERYIAWFRQQQLLIETKIPQEIKYPINAFCSLRGKGDFCEFL